MRPLKIAYLFQNIDFQFTEPFAVQLHISYQIDALQQSGHTVSLVALQGRNVLCTEDLEAVRGGQVGSRHFAKPGMSRTKVYRLFESGLRRVQTNLKLPYFALFDSHRMYEACVYNLRGYDILHERFNLLAFGGALASRKLNIPYVLEVNADLIAEGDFQGKPEKGAQRKFAIWATRFCFDTAQRIICVSADLKKYLAEKWALDNRKFVVLPNAADTDAFGQERDLRSIRHQLGLTDEPVVMFVGGFYPWHDLSLLVASFTNLLRTVPEARLVLVGDGETRPELEQMINEQDLRHAVIMTGAVDHRRVPELLAIADVAVAPNIPFFGGHGGSPLKIFEYMAAGKAIIASETGQIAEVIRHGHNGLLVKPGDAEGLAQAMLRLVEDPAERARLGNNARRQAVERHSWHHYSKELEQIYRGVS